MREALRASLLVDRHLVRPVAGAVTAVPVVVVFAVGLAVSSPRTAISMAIGANLIAIVSLVGAPRPPVQLAILDSLLMGVAVVIGTLSGTSAWEHALVLIPWCFGAGLLVAFGPTQGVVGSQLVIAFVVLGRYSGSWSLALHLGSLVTLGALVEVLALVVLKLPPTLRFQRQSLAHALDAVAQLARRDPRQPAADVATALDDVETLLGSPSLFGRTDVRDLRGALDQARRMRIELTALSGLGERAGDTDSNATGVRAAREHLAVVLDQLALQLRQPRSTHSVHNPLRAFEASVGQLDDDASNADDQSAIAFLEALGGQARAILTLLEDERRHDHGRAWLATAQSFKGQRPPPLSDIVAVARASVTRDSPSRRHAVRLALAVPASAAIAAALSLPRGYWVPFSVAAILKPDYSTLLSRGVGRVVGTMFGATLAAVVISELHPSLVLTTALVALTAWLAYSMWSASFSIAIGLVTSLVLILLSTSSLDPVSTAADRFIDVALGAAIAVIAYLVWPTSPRAGVIDAMSELFGALDAYLGVVARMITGEKLERDEILHVGRASRIAWARSEAAVGRSIDEPSSTRLDPETGRGLLAAAMRIVRALHALRLESERGSTTTSNPSLDALVGGLRAVLAAEATPAATTAPDAVELRRFFESAVLDLRASHAPEALVGHLDELVNAVNTTRLLSERAFQAER